MKKLFATLTLVTLGITGCYGPGYRDHDNGYRRDRDHHEDRDRRGGHDNREGDRSEHDGDRRH